MLILVRVYDDGETKQDKKVTANFTLIKLSPGSKYLYGSFFVKTWSKGTCVNLTLSHCVMGDRAPCNITSYFLPVYKVLQKKRFSLSEARILGKL